MSGRVRRERSLSLPSGQNNTNSSYQAGCVLTALDVDSAGGVLPPQRVLRHTRVIPRILQPGAVDLDSGVFAAGQKHIRQVSRGNGRHGDATTLAEDDGTRGDGRLAAPTWMWSLGLEVEPGFNQPMRNVPPTGCVQVVFSV